MDFRKYGKTLAWDFFLSSALLIIRKEIHQYKNRHRFEIIPKITGPLLPSWPLPPHWAHCAHFVS